MEPKSLLECNSDDSMAKYFNVMKNQNRKTRDFVPENSLDCSNQNVILFLTNLMGCEGNLIVLTGFINGLNYCKKEFRISDLLLEKERCGCGSERKKGVGRRKGGTVAVKYFFFVLV